MKQYISLCNQVIYTKTEMSSCISQIAISETADLNVKTYGIIGRRKIKQIEIDEIE